MKKIGLLCLCLASLSLAGCFHIPDEDWLPSRNKIETGKYENNQVEQAINSLIDGIDIISSQGNELNNQQSGDIITENSDENLIEIKDDGTASNESIDGETGDITTE